MPPGEEHLLLEFRGLIFLTFVADCQFISAFCTTGCKYSSAVFAGHSFSEAMNMQSFASAWLKCSFHCFTSKFIICLTLLFSIFRLVPLSRLVSHNKTHNRITKITIFSEISKCFFYYYKLYL